MDVLKDKATKEYVDLSRYAKFYIYFHTLDQKYMYGLTGQLNTEGVSYTLHNVKKTDTLDSLANYYYGRPDYFWIIADFNRIQDPFIKLSDYFKTIKIPSVAELKYREFNN